MPSNGSAKAYAGRLPLQDHRVVGMQLQAIRRALVTAGTLVQDAYGRSHRTTKALQRVIDTLELAQAHLAQAAQAEHSGEPAVSTLYYPEPDR
jgi:hypothetical protein